ncbi:MAG: pyridoxal phosphate-dependent aminotransferase [Candidatus Thermoplasmatota archaeon]
MTEKKKFASSLYRLSGEAAFETLAKAKQLEREGKEIIHFEIGEPDFNTSEIIKQAAKKGLDLNLTHYVPSAGLLELREAVREYIRIKRGFEPELEQVVITPGVKPAVFYSILSLVESGDEVIYPDPGYPTYYSLIDYIGAKRVPVKLVDENEFRMSPEGIAEKITDKTKLIILNSPENPTGGVNTEEDMRGIAELAKDNNLWIVSDEIYSEIIYEGKHYSPCTYDTCAERSVLVNGFSKCFAMTGWRLGYIITNKELARKITTFITNSVSCTNAFVQYAGIEALRKCDREVKEMVDEFKKRRDAIVKGLNSVRGFKCLIPRGAFYVFPNIEETNFGCEDLAELLLKKVGVCTLAGTAFGEGGKGHLRFSYANSIENIEKGIELIKSLLG